MFMLITVIFNVFEINTNEQLPKELKFLLMIFFITL